MKIAILFSTMLLVGTACAGSNPSDDELKDQIIALDTDGWNSWAKNDPTWFVENTTESFVSISSSGVASKAEVVKGVPADCKVSSFSLSDFSFTRLDENAVLLTYIAHQDAMCGTDKAPETVRVAVNYVRRHGRWLEAMYMQSP